MVSCPGDPLPACGTRLCGFEHEPRAFSGLLNGPPASSVASSLAPPLGPCQLLTFGGDTSSELQTTDGDTVLLRAVLSTQHACGRVDRRAGTCSAAGGGGAWAISVSTLESPLPWSHKGQDSCLSKSTHSCLDGL